MNARAILAALLFSLPWSIGASAGNAKEDLRAARIAVRELHRPDSHCSIDMLLLYTAIAEDGVALMELGITAGDVRHFRSACDGARAKRFLANLKHPDITCGADLSIFRELVADGGLSLKDVGTTNGEVRRLTAACHRAQAQEYLLQLRKNLNGRQCGLELIQLYGLTSTGDFSLESIGTSGKEIAGLRAACRKVQREVRPPAPQRKKGPFI